MFKSGNTFEDIVNKATSEKLTSENWELILEVCDRITENPSGAKDCFSAINRRILHRNPNVIYYTLSLVESLVKNCGKPAQEQVASRFFTTTLIRILADKSVSDQIKKRILGDIQQWAFEFRQDPDLSLMEETFKKLQAQGKRFPQPQKPQKIPKQAEAMQREEEEHLQLALALSLSDVDSRRQTSTQIRNEITRQQTISKNTTSPTENEGEFKPINSTQASNKNKIQIKVKALFDFKPTEPGELGFVKGDVIVVLDQKYRDWWRGELRNKQGIFPANFVQPMKDPKSDIKDLEPIEDLVLSESHNVEVLLRMLSRMDPERDNLSENTELQTLYSSTLALRPKIVKLIEEFSKKKDEYVALNDQLEEAMNTYQGLLTTTNQTPNASYQLQQPHVYNQHHPNTQPQPQPSHVANATSDSYYNNLQQGFQPSHNQTQSQNQPQLYNQYQVENQSYVPQNSQPNSHIQPQTQDPKYQQSLGTQYQQQYSYGSENYAQGANPNQQPQGSQPQQYQQHYPYNQQH